jgi:hypothetical protein
MPAEQRKRRRWSVVNGLLKPSVVTGILTPCLSGGQSNAGLLQFVDIAPCFSNVARMRWTTV